jgi:hypothetical protein
VSDSEPTDLYLNLLKKTLSYSLWPEPPLPIGSRGFSGPYLVRRAGGLFNQVVGKMGLQLVRPRTIGPAQRAGGGYWPAYAHTMIGTRRLDDLQLCVETVLREGIPGDLIETGVWRGGACIFMRAVLAAHGVTDRKVYVADSFAGLPPPDVERYPVDQGDALYRADILAVSQATVADNFRQYGLLDDQVVFLKGWFKDTLPVAPVDQLAVLRLDGDLYSSTMESLTYLYPKLSAGGFCIIDDYSWPGCRQAVDDYAAQHGLTLAPTTVGPDGYYWRKA